MRRIRVIAFWNLLILVVLAVGYIREKKNANSLRREIQESTPTLNYETKCVTPYGVVIKVTLPDRLWRIDYPVSAVMEARDTPVGANLRVVVSQLLQPKTVTLNV